jgi:DedD protein
MRLPSFLQRKSASGAQRVPLDEGAAQQERARARRRLIGAVVLVLLGVVGLPMIFDRAPKPLAVDIAIEIPGKDSVAPLPTPPASRATKKDATPLAEAPAEPVTAVTSPASAAKPAEPAASLPRTPEKPISPAADVAEAARARAALEDRSPAARPTTPKQASRDDAAGDSRGRFVVQVGAFSEADSARDARTRVEKLGFKTYTQSVETSNGKRIRVRVGPYADRAEAERVAAQIKQAGIASAVLGL